MPNTRRNAVQQALSEELITTPTTQEARLFNTVREGRSIYQASSVADLFAAVSQERVANLAVRLEAYIGTNLAATIEKKGTLADYRTNPYVLMASGSVMSLDDPREFARFLRDTKLYMSLETSFGKSIEGIVLGAYPIGAAAGHAWEDPAEKLAESAKLRGLSNEQKARARANSVWREIDRSCVLGNVRYLVSVKSGPNTINDTQVDAMQAAICAHHQRWLEESKRLYGVERLDIVLGLTYGTARTTNNKDNQIIVKLLECGFKEIDSVNQPGILVDAATGFVRVYRVVGSDFWAFIANPNAILSAPFAFLEVLLALAIALKRVSAKKVPGHPTIEDRLNSRLQMLSLAIAELSFPSESLPAWVTAEIGERELFWLAAAMTAFYDQGV